MERRQGHNHTENAKYFSSLFYFYFLVTEKYAYFCGFSWLELPVLLRVYKIQHTFCSHFPWQRWCPHYYYIKKDTPWYFSAICSNFLLYHRHRYFCPKKTKTYTLAQLSNSNMFSLRFKNERKKNMMENFSKIYSTFFIISNDHFWMVSWFVFVFSFLLLSLLIKRIIKWKRAQFPYKLCVNFWRKLSLLVWLARWLVACLKLMHKYQHVNVV